MHNKTAIFSLLAGCLLATGCSLAPEKPMPEGALPRPYVANEEPFISLQNLKTRVIIRCYNSVYESAETCAQIYESEGYVRLRDIPYKIAKYDRLQVDTYPTRRWRPGERTPRW